MERTLTLHLSRKELLLGGLGLAGALATGCGGGTTARSGGAPSRPADRDHILVGRVAPLTGPIASFGDGTPWMEQQAIDAINKDGGLFIKELNKKLPVKMKVVDSESDTTKAAEVAGKLIVDDKVDVMVVLHTPATVNPVSATCERYRMPCISMDAPTSAWLTGGPYKWSYHAFWTDDQIVDMYAAMWEGAPTNKKVGFLFGNDADGVAWAKQAKDSLPGKGFSIVDTGRFPAGTKDYSAIISQFKRENVEIVFGNLPPPDFATAWRQCHEQGFVPKIATIGRAILFPQDVAAIGSDLGVGLTTEVWWSPYHPFKSSLTGETAKEMTDKWVASSGKQWYPTIGFKHAVFEVLADALKRSQTLEKEALRDAIGATDLQTIVGPIKYNEQHFCKTPLVAGQWAKGADGKWNMEIVDNRATPTVTKTADLVVPLPKR